MGKRWRAAIKPSLQPAWNARAGWTSRDRTFTRPTQQRFLLLLVRISSFQGAPPAWAVLPAPEGLFVRGQGCASCRWHPQQQGRAREAPGTAGFAEEQLLSLARAAGCALVSWPLAQLMFEILLQQNAGMEGDGTGGTKLCVPAPGGTELTRPLGLGYLTKINAFAGAGLAILTKELQLDKEMPLTVPAVSRISSIHCWQSTSTCWGKKGTKSSEQTAMGQAGGISAQFVLLAHRALSTCTAQGWAALLLED